MSRFRNADPSFHRVILALLLCVIAARADKPIVIKESETTCPHAASFCLRARLSQFFAKIEGGCEWPDLGVRLVSSAHPDVRREPLSQREARVAWPCSRPLSLFLEHENQSRCTAMRIFIARKPQCLKQPHVFRHGILLGGRSTLIQRLCEPM